jgi:hypothetical protein
MCGTGGGVDSWLFNSSRRLEALQATLQRELADQSPELNDFTWHTCTICDSGLTVKMLEASDDTDIMVTLISWHGMGERILGVT